MSDFLHKQQLNEAVIKTRLEEVFPGKRQLRVIVIIHSFSAAFLVSLTSSLNYSVAQTHRPPFDDVVKCFKRVENFHFFYDVNSGREKRKIQVFHYCECGSESPTQLHTLWLEFPQAKSLMNFRPNGTRETVTAKCTLFSFAR